MTRKVTKEFMVRRQAMSAAKGGLTNAMCDYELTSIEWLQVLHEITQRIIQHAMYDQLEEECEQ